MNFGHEALMDGLVPYSTCARVIRPRKEKNGKIDQRMV